MHTLKNRQNVNSIQTFTTQISTHQEQYAQVSWIAICNGDRNIQLVTYFSQYKKCLIIQIRTRLLNIMRI